MKRRLISGALALVPLAIAAWQGQNKKTPPRTFDVASVKPNLSGGGNFQHGRFAWAPDRHKCSREDAGP